jgi:4-amino-4-deoxy-L-arabinose transferase-like glycosyltransferase
MNRFLIILTLGSLAIRLAFIAIAPAVPPIVDLDSVDYDQIARHVAAGQGFGYGPGQLSSFRPPLYPLFLAAIYWVVGVNHGVVRILQAIIGAFLPAIVYLVVRRRFPIREAQVGAVLCAVYPALIGMSGTFLTEVIYIPLFALAILSLVLLEEQPTWGRVLLSGILLGLTLLARTSAVTLIFLLPFWMFWKNFPPAIAGGNKRGVLKVRTANFIKGIVIGLIAVLTVLPWTARNWHVHHAFIPVSSNGGHIFWLGFHQLDRQANQDFTRAEQYRSQEGRKAKTETYFQLSAEDNTLGLPMLQRVYAERYPQYPLPSDEASLNSAYFARTVDFIKEHPAAVVVKIIKDTLRVPYLFDHFGRYVVSFGCLLPFLVAGLWITRKRWQELSLFYVVFISLWMLEVVFHPTPRFRLPYEPFMLPFAAAAGVALFYKWGWKHFFPYTIVGIVIAANLIFYAYSDSVRHLFRALASALGLPVSPY